MCSVKTSVSPFYCTCISCKEQFHFVSPLYSIWLLHSETSSNKALLVKQETQLTASCSPSTFSEWGKKKKKAQGSSPEHANRGAASSQWREQREEPSPAVSRSYEDAATLRSFHLLPTDPGEDTWELVSEWVNIYIIVIALKLSFDSNLTSIQIIFHILPE